MTIIITPDVRTTAHLLPAHLDAICARNRASDEERDGGYS